MKKTLYKRGLQIALPLLAVLGMIGCTPTIHHSPDLLVQDKKNKVEKQIVDRPFKDVANTYEKMSRKCLNFSIRHSGDPRYNPTGTFVYGAKTQRTPNRLRVSMQKYMEGTEEYMKTGEIPYGGLYIGVVDIVPAGKNKTQITFYQLDNFAYHIPKEYMHAFNGWSTGEYVGCPTIE